MSTCLNFLRRLCWRLLLFLPLGAGAHTLPALLLPTLAAESPLASRLLRSRLSARLSILLPPRSRSAHARGRRTCVCTNARGVIRAMHARSKLLSFPGAAQAPGLCWVFHRRKRRGGGERSASGKHRSSTSARAGTAEAGGLFARTAGSE